MIEDVVKRDEFKDTVDRIHNRIDEMAKVQARMDVNVEHIKKFGDDIHKLVYGNGHDGLITRITRLFERVSLHTKIFVSVGGAVLVGFIGWLFRKYL